MSVLVPVSLLQLHLLAPSDLSAVRPPLTAFHQQVGFTTEPSGGGGGGGGPGGAPLGFGPSPSAHIYHPQLANDFYSATPYQPYHHQHHQQHHHDHHLHQYAHHRYHPTTASLSHGGYHTPNNIAFSNSPEVNEILRPLVVQTDPASGLRDEGRFTAPRVFFDDDQSEESRERRLQEFLREERLRQQKLHRPPLHDNRRGGVPLRETRRYEKSVEGDLDFSEDKKLKLLRRRRRDTVAQTGSAAIGSSGSSTDGSDDLGVEERRPNHGRQWRTHAATGAQPQRQQNQQRPHGQQTTRRPVREDQRGQRQQRPQQTSRPPSTLRGQDELYGAFRGSFGGQRANQGAGKTRRP